MTHGALVPRWAWLAACALSLILMLPTAGSLFLLHPADLLSDEASWWMDLSPHEPLLFAVAQQLVHVLTYPLGVVAEALVMLLLVLGLATTSEALIAAWPLYVGLGYVQWFVVLPRLCERACRARPGR
jgi:hypothetical protein